MIRKLRITVTDGKRYAVQHHNLDAIISVGYRVDSVRATRFRQWATSVLRDFAIRGYVIDRQRMDNGAFLGEDHFERLLDEIREIRLSERRFYQKVTDIYAISIDYNKDVPTPSASSPSSRTSSTSWTWPSPAPAGRSPGTRRTGPNAWATLSTSTTARSSTAQAASPRPRPTSTPRASSRSSASPKTTSSR